MKKIIIFIIFLLSITQVSNASLVDSILVNEVVNSLNRGEGFGKTNSLDLYKNINNGIINLQDQIEKKDLEGGDNGGGILSEINKYAIINEFPVCLDENKNLSTENFKKIVNKKDISSKTGLVKYLIPNCLDSLLKEEGQEKITKEYESKIEDTENEPLSSSESSRVTDCQKDYSTLKRLIIKDGEQVLESYEKQNSKELCESRTKSARKQLLREERNQKINNYGKDNSPEKESFLIKVIEIYLDLFQTYNYDKTELAKIKTDQTYKVSNIGLYADGSEENSGFDLIIDIENIDKIIFADVMEYEGENPIPVDDLMKELEEKTQNKINDLLGNNDDKENDTVIENVPDLINPIKEVAINENIKETTNNYICSDDLNNNGLSTDSLNGLLNNINNNLSGGNNINLGGNLDLGNNNNNGGNKNGNNNNTDGGSYSEVSDDWPCESFFCIDINFKTYEHSLFGGGENITIEYLLNRSNKHLSKAAATSLIPAKMGTNQFELGLKDMNLPDIFHLSFQISTKPIPILDLKKEGEDNSEFSAKNMLEEYYKINGLDYKRRNDLVLLDNMEQKKQAVNNGVGLTTEELLKKQIENDNIVEKRHAKRASLLKAIDNKASFGITGVFEEQFTEIDKFTSGINDYVNNMHSLIIKLKEIPIEY